MVDVEMAIPSAPLRPSGPVSGKLDTGTTFTMLTFSTARQLGIDPGSFPLELVPRKSATGGDIRYFTHSVVVWISEVSALGSSFRIGFTVEAGFSKDINGNLFGLDWLDNLCIALDGGAMHFCK